MRYQLNMPSWTKEWNASPKTGRFAAANRIPPSLNVTPHFRDLKDNREVFGRLVQCRTGHGYTGEYYQQFVPSESPSCPCGEHIQSRVHILRDCPRYEPFRDTLRKISRDISLPEIVGTKNGISALHTFLKESGAFTKSGKPRTNPIPPHFDDESEVSAESDSEEDSDHG